MAIDEGTLRGLYTLFILALFIIIVVNAYNKKRKNTFDEIANSIFDENIKDDDHKENNKQETNNNV